MNQGPASRTAPPGEFVNVLSLDRLQLGVFLGHTDEERAHPQPVEIWAAVAFKQAPQANQNDELEDTVCYDQLVKIIKTVCHERDFRLIEFLAQKIYDCIRLELNPEDRLAIKVTKLNPPVVGLRGGASFFSGDWFPGELLWS